MGKKKKNRKMWSLRRFLPRQDRERPSDTDLQSQTSNYDPHLNIDASPNAIIYSSELDYIARCIADYPDIETGGQLFGAWTASGAPRVIYAIGPGPRANHQSAFFNQDVDYLTSVGSKLKEYGLQHIGEWHSHHKLGLAHPSGHDANTMYTSISELKLHRFLLCIGNISSNGGISINPFNFAQGKHYIDARWDVITEHNRLRDVIDHDLNNFLIHPQSRNVTFKEQYYTPKEQSINDVQGWFGFAENRLEFKKIIDTLKSQSWIEDIRPQINQDGMVTIKISTRRFVEIVSLPSNFPKTPFSVQRMSLIENECTEYTPQDWEVPIGSSISEIFKTNYINYLRSHQ